jgi:hypothetical protein
MLKVANSVINASRITGVLPVVNGGTGVTTSTGTGNTVLSASPTLSGDVTLSTGNLVIGTAGKGIDFTVTPGTGTSELLDDYEEGTWTPTLLAGTTNFTSVTYNGATYGRYTKIGSLVSVTGYMRTDAITVGSAAGSLLIGGLPFTPDFGPSAGSIGESRLWSLNNPSGLGVQAGVTSMNLYYRLTANGETATMDPTMVDTGAVKNIVQFQATYSV